MQKTYPKLIQYMTHYAVTQVYIKLDENTKYFCTTQVIKFACNKKKQA